MFQRIVISGGSGYLGKALVARLVQEQREVVVLTRSSELPPELARLPNVRAVRWDAGSPGEWEKTLDGAFGVVHLAGEQAVGARYTEAVKRRIFDSRVKTAQAIVRAIGNAEHRPKVLVSASGVGYYGARGDEACDEETPPGDDFLAGVCVAWEGAAREAETLGVRVVSARFGIVLGPGGGALSVMSRPYRMFVGGPIGSGRQMFSWVHLDDALSAIERCLLDATLSGPVNVAAPHAVTHAELAQKLGRTLKRPSLIPAPSFALKLLFGEGATPLLTGQRAVPKKLEQAGFRFAHPDLDEALSASLR